MYDNNFCLRRKTSVNRQIFWSHAGRQQGWTPRTISKSATGVIVIPTENLPLSRSPMSTDSTWTSTDIGSRKQRSENGKFSTHVLRLRDDLIFGTARPVRNLNAVFQVRLREACLTWKFGFGSAGTYVAWMSLWLCLGSDNQLDSRGIVSNDKMDPAGQCPP